MNNKLFWAIEIMCLFSLITSCFTLGFLLQPNIVRWITHPTSSLNYSSNCSNLSLEETANCLRNDFASWYKYNISNLEKSYDEEVLKREGGVCWQAAKWYLIKSKGLDFYSDTIIISFNETSAHEFAIISNDEGYCLLDQKLMPVCQ